MAIDGLFKGLGNVSLYLRGRFFVWCGGGWRFRLYERVIGISILWIMGSERANS